MVKTVHFERDEEGYILDENGERVLNNEPTMSPKTGKRKKGKPQAISKKKILEIARVVSAGNYVKTSVKACGVNFSTFNMYMNKGRKGISPYDEYFEIIEQAKAQAEVDMSTRINESGLNGNVGADMWKLQRMFPNRWGNAQRQEIKVDNSQEIRIVKYSEKIKSDGKDKE